MVPVYPDAPVAEPEPSALGPDRRNLAVLV